MINLGYELEARPGFGLSQSQRQVVGLNQSIKLWEEDPQQLLPEAQVGKTVRLGRDQVSFNLGEFWKRQVRHDLLNLPSGESVTVGVTSTGSGAGKGSISEGLLYFAKHDLFMHSKSVGDGFFVIPVVLPFAMYMKAAQIPKDRGGPGIVDPNSGHGRFTTEAYSQGSDFGKWLYIQHSSSRRPDARFLYIVEGSGTPWITKKGPNFRVGGMPDRGASVVFDKPTNGKKYVLIVDRNEQVAAGSKNSRDKYDPESSDFSSVFKNGRERFLLTNRMGRSKDVGEMSYSIQKAVIELLKMATAPSAAIERSDSEFMAMKIKLADQGVISGISNESYLAALRNRLVSGRGGYKEDEVYVVDNPWRFNDEIDHDLDYFLRSDLVARLFSRQLLPARLRGTYMDFPPDHIYLGSKKTIA